MRTIIPGRLHASHRPGYPARRVPITVVDRWLAEARALHVDRILCLLDARQLAYYGDVAGGLLEHYRRAGFIVSHHPVKDHQMPPVPTDILEVIAAEYATTTGSFLVHCSAGVDRTGAVLGQLLQQGEPTRSRVE